MKQCVMSRIDKKHCVDLEKIWLKATCQGKTWREEMCQEKTL
jgi:hypothetical protein